MLDASTKENATRRPSFSRIRRFLPFFDLIFFSPCIRALSDRVPRSEQKLSPSVFRRLCGLPHRSPFPFETRSTLLFPNVQRISPNPTMSTTPFFTLLAHLLALNANHSDPFSLYGPLLCSVLSRLNEPELIAVLFDDLCERLEPVGDGRIPDWIGLIGKDTKDGLSEKSMAKLVVAVRIREALLKVSSTVDLSFLSSPHRPFQLRPRALVFNYADNTLLVPPYRYSLSLLSASLSPSPPSPPSRLTSQPRTWTFGRPSSKSSPFIPFPPLSSLSTLEHLFTTLWKTRTLSWRMFREGGSSSTRSTGRWLVSFRSLSLFPYSSRTSLTFCLFFSLLTRSSYRKSAMGSSQLGGLCSQADRSSSAFLRSLLETRRRSADLSPSFSSHSTLPSSPIFESSKNLSTPLSCASSFASRRIFLLKPRFVAIPPLFLLFPFANLRLPRLVLRRVTFEERKTTKLPMSSSARFSARCEG